MTTRAIFSFMRAAAPLLLVACAAIAPAACSGNTDVVNGSAGAGAQGAGTSTSANGGSSTTTMSSSAAGTGGKGTGGNGTGAGLSGCMGDGDCVADPQKTKCDTNTGECVGCLPNDPCMMGEFCDPNTKQCSAGCTDDMDCGNGLKCDLATNQCVGCLMDVDCPFGTICSAGACIPGCTPSHQCAGSDTCCSGECDDLATSPTHCGDCNTVCPLAANAAPICNAGVCGIACNVGFADCNLDPADGCEWNVLQDGDCTCVPQSTQVCYQGAPGTDGVGPCHGGTQTCDASGTFYGPCTGQVLPQPEICANNIDEDCDGVKDNAFDADGDGWTTCNGDCCDVVGPNCPDPKLVNPGALEVVGNGIDDDCNPATSDVVPVGACSTVQKFAGVTASDVAKAMEICQTTTANPPLPTKTWGLITSTQLYANGAVPPAAALTLMQNEQTAIMTAFGTGGVLPKKNATMASISSGKSRDANDPGWVLPIGGTAYAGAIAFPGAPPLSTYVNAHGGNLLPGKCGNMTCPVGTGANDSVNIRFVIRTPTNAQGFSYDFRFYSAEYQTFQCTAFNDYFLAMLQSGAPAIPADHDISFDANKNAVSVNNGFFQDCGGNGKNCGPCPGGTGSLAGTGFDQVQGGSTEWLTTDAPIVPGETITLELVVFDVQDHIYDTLVLLDNFRWALSPVTLGTHQ